jgi:hypothetical protein
MEVNSMNARSDQRDIQPVSFNLLAMNHAIIGIANARIATLDELNIGRLGFVLFLCLLGDLGRVDCRFLADCMYVI